MGYVGVIIIYRTDKEHGTWEDPGKGLGFRG